MLKLTASSFVLVGCLSVSVLLPNATMAKTKYLLNCRLMDRAELLYDRFCRGENAKQLRMFCLEDKSCLVHVSNFTSQYVQGRKSLFGELSRHDPKMAGGNGGSMSRVASNSTTSGSGEPPSGPIGDPPQ
jgi:hypothetical protein